MDRPKLLGAPEMTDAQNATILRAVQFVLKEKELRSAVKEITETKLQVVAGTNSSFKLKLEDGSVHDVVVYEDLEKKMYITQFE